MNETFSIDELQDVFTERSMVAEATSRATVRKGAYKVTFRQVVPKVAGEKSPFPGRRLVTLGLDIHIDRDKKTTMFQDVSWELYRETSIGGERVVLKEGDEGYDASLKMDKQARLWSQLEKVFNPDGSLSIPEVVQAIAGSQAESYIMEGFVGPDGGLPQWPQTNQKDYPVTAEYYAAYDAERAEFAKQGLQPRNYLVNFNKVKEG